MVSTSPKSLTPNFCQMMPGSAVYLQLMQHFLKHCVEFSLLERVPVGRWGAWD